MKKITWIILFLICPPAAITALWGKIVKNLFKLLVMGYMISYFLIIVSLLGGI